MFDKSQILNLLQIPNLEFAQCPANLSTLQKVIKKRNNIVKQLNNIQKAIENTLVGVEISEGVILTSEVLFNILINLPLPSSTGAPGVPGLFVSEILKIQDNKEEIGELINKLKLSNSILLTNLISVNTLLQLLLGVLGILDELVQKCSEGDDLILEQVNSNIRQLQQTKPPVVNEVNGFTMSVETENTTKDLKRKRAIAKNQQGVILLRGEYSYSAIDQILIDELVFYIKNNDLKAN